MPINPNTFGAPPAPPAPPHASWPPSPHAPLPHLSDAPQSRKRWPGILAGAAAGALVATLISALVTTQIGNDSASTSSTTTRTVAAPTPAAPAPLPVAQADRQTCGGWLEAGRLIDAADAALAPLPKGMRIDEPPAKTRPELTKAIKDSADLWNKAAGAIRSQIAPGATPILAAAATTAANTLAGEGNSYASFDAVGGATFNRITNAAAAEMAALCRRLAPL